MVTRRNLNASTSAIRNIAFVLRGEILRTRSEIQAQSLAHLPFDLFIFWEFFVATKQSRHSSPIFLNFFFYYFLALIPSSLFGPPLFSLSSFLVCSSSPLLLLVLFWVPEVLFEEWKSPIPSSPHTSNLSFFSSTGIHMSLRPLQ